MAASDTYITNFTRDLFLLYVRGRMIVKFKVAHLISKA